MSLRRITSTNFLPSQAEPAEIEHSLTTTHPPAALHPPSMMEGISIGTTYRAYPSSSEIREAVVNHYPEFETLPSSLAASSSARMQPESASPSHLLRTTRAIFATFEQNPTIPDLDSLTNLIENVRSLNETAIASLNQHEGNEEIIGKIAEHDRKINDKFNQSEKGDYDLEYQSEMLTSLRDAFNVSSTILEDPTIEQHHYEMTHTSSHESEEVNHSHEAVAAHEQKEASDEIPPSEDNTDDWDQHVDMEEPPNLSATPSPSLSGHTDPELDDLGGVIGNFNNPNIS